MLIKAMSWRNKSTCGFLSRKPFCNDNKVKLKKKQTHTNKKQICRWMAFVPFHVIDINSMCNLMAN
jgi:hypothetical protein